MPLASFDFWSGTDQSEKHGNNKSENHPNFHKRAIILAPGATVKTDRYTAELATATQQDKRCALCDLCD